MKISLQWMERLYSSRPRYLISIGHSVTTLLYTLAWAVWSIDDSKVRNLFVSREGGVTHSRRENRDEWRTHDGWFYLRTLPATGNRWKRGTRDDDRSNEWYANINFVFPDSCLSRGQSDFWMGLDVMAASSPFSGILSLCPSHCIDLPHLSIESILFWLLFFLARFLSLYKVIDLINVLTISPLYFILKFLLSTFLVEIFINSDPIFFSVGGLFTNLLSWDWVNSIILQWGDG